jgi:hypothetical protein
VGFEIVVVVFTLGNYFRKLKTSALAITCTVL